MNTQRTSLFLMANLGSEVSKMILAKEKNDLLVFGITISKIRQMILQLKNLPDTINNKEIDLLTEVIEDFIKKDSKFNISSNSLRSYFNPFAIKLMSEYQK